MTWIKIDDGFADHPKIRSVGAYGQAIQLAAICYCGRFLTNGFLSYSAADALIRTVLAPVTGLNQSSDASSDGQVTPQVKSKSHLTNTSSENEVDLKLSTRIYTHALTSGMAGMNADELFWPAIMVNAGLWDVVDGGYLVHDYLDYNPSKEEVLERKSASSKGGRNRHAASSTTSSDGQVTPEVKSKSHLQNTSSTPVARSRSPEATTEASLLPPNPLQNVDKLKTAANGRRSYGSSNDGSNEPTGKGRIFADQPAFWPQVNEFLEELQEPHVHGSLSENDLAGLRNDLKKYGLPCKAVQDWLTMRISKDRSEKRAGEKGMDSQVGWLRAQIRSPDLN